MGFTAALTRAAANTSTGTQDITTTDLGGLTPKAVLLVATRCVTEDTLVDGLGFYVGLTDGVLTVNQSAEEQHGQANADGMGETDTTSPPLLIIYDGTADSVIEGSANFDSFITNGVRIDWTDAPASAFLITAYFFAGTDLSVDVFSVSLGNSVNNAVDITAPGFEPDVVLTLLHGDVGRMLISHGFIHNDRAGTVTQRAVQMGHLGGAGTMANNTAMQDDACIIENLSTGGDDWYGEASSFDSSGFTVTVRLAGANNLNLAGLALRFGSSPVVSSKVYTLSTPTSTGSFTDSTPNFQPQFVMYLATRVATAGTTETDSDGGSFSVIAADADDLYSNNVSSQDGAADSNTDSRGADNLLLTTDQGAPAHEASLTSMGSTGPVWNFGVTAAGAKVWAALAIGVNPAVASGNPWYAYAQQ